MVRRQLGLGSELYAGSFGAGNALCGAFLDKVALKFTDGGEHVEQQTARRAAGVDGLVEDDKVDNLALDLIRDLREVEDGAGEAVEPRHNKLVAFADECQSLSKRFTLVAGGAALLLLEDLLAAVGLQLVELGFEVLPDGRDAGVSDFHGYQMC